MPAWANHGTDAVVELAFDVFVPVQTNPRRIREVAQDLDEQVTKVGIHQIGFNLGFLWMTTA